MTPYTLEEVTLIEQNYKNMNKQELLDLIPKHSWISISNKARKLGLSKSKGVNRSTKLDVLIDDTLENCYWWGFIYSDGYISNKGRLAIHLHEKDLCHLKRLGDRLSVKTEVRPIGGHPMAVIDIMDKVNGLFLKNKLQITTKKTYNPPLGFDFLPTCEQRLSFLMGFIDGDGTITYRNNIFKSVRIVVHENWFDFFGSLCYKLQQDFEWINFTVTKNGRGNTCIYFGTKNSYNQCLNFSQQNNIPLMERKWRPYEKDNRKEN